MSARERVVRENQREASIRQLSAAEKGNSSSMRLLHATHFMSVHSRLKYLSTGRRVAGREGETVGQSEDDLRLVKGQETWRLSCVCGRKSRSAVSTSSARG